MDKYLILEHNKTDDSSNMYDTYYPCHESALVNARRAAVDDAEGNYAYLVCKVETIVNSDVVAVESSFDDGGGDE